MENLAAAPEPTQNVANPIDENLDTRASGGGRVAPEPVEQKPDAARKPESVAASLEAAAKEIEDDKKAETDAKAAAKEAAKAKEAENKAAKVDGKEPAKAENPKPNQVQPATAEEEAAQADEVKQRGPETREIIEAPARLLPRSKELWKIVPHELRADLLRIEKEATAEMERHREAVSFREELKEYEGLAKRHGTSVKQALDNYVGIERKFSEDPSQGFKQLLGNMNMQPKDAIGHILRAYNVTPQALAAHIAQNPTEYTALASQRQQQPANQSSPDPRYQALEQKIASMEEAQQNDHAQRVFETEIKPFWQDHPEAQAKWPAIEEILVSGIIERIHGSGLSPRDKLEVALGMVAPSAFNVTARQPANEQPAPVGDLRGDKSIKSSLGAVSDADLPQKKMSTRELLEDEMRKLSRRA
jgi:hypothetical protein